jgi:DNA-binding beta-propeller fold protein YncE
MKLLLTLALAVMPGFAADPVAGPSLPHKLVPNWAQLPAGWNFGEVSGVAVDKDDSVWVFNRGPHPMVQFDKTGKMIQAWKEVPIKSSHGVRVDPQGNVWAVDVAGHAVVKFNRSGRVLMVIAQPGNAAGDNNSNYAFNRPTGVSFSANGDIYVSDGYVNSRVVKYNKDLEYLSHWGKKGKGDGEFDLVHDVAVDSKGRVYVADRSNSRVQVFDESGRFIAKWTDVGQPWGLIYSTKEDVLYMCDGLNNRISKLSLDGKVLGVLSSFGKMQGKVDFAHNIAIDSTGALYVAEIKNWRVQKFAPTHP